MPPNKIVPGPFARSRENAINFGQNLFLASMMDECVRNLLKAEKDHAAALLLDDEELMAQKQLEAQTFQTSLTLTAYMFDEMDDVST